jgi:23S rRNA (pseudouridine1915-N3)-methyltransferase
MAEYVGRIQPFASFKLEFLKVGSRETESAALRDRSAGLLRVVLDERGEHLSSRALAARVSQWEQRRVKGVAVLLGGADGHTEELRAAADWVWSLSELTLQHELATVVALEQIYRAYTLKAGLPYHRD